MGQPKALLDWRGRPAVLHAVEVVREGCAGGPVCVVRAPGQELPPLDAIVVDDAVAHRGPLGGLHAGLTALAGQVEIAFVCGVDTPLLVPAFVRRVCASLDGDDAAVVPVIDGRAQPLLAAYRTAIVPALQVLLDRGAFGLKDIPSACTVRELSEQELLADADLRAIDPGLRSAANANTPEEWVALVGEK
jgi:molybdopterin-guanine dinucleotide biosynthesis protein A